MHPPRPKRQHYVPQLHLKHFADERNHVWTYDTSTGDVRSSLPSQTAVETNFYSLVDDNGQHDDALEIFLSKVESDAAITYEKLLRGEIPTGTDRANFARFLATLYVRGPAMLRVFGQIYGAGALQVLSTLASDREKFNQAMSAMPRQDGEGERDMDALFAAAQTTVAKSTIQVDRKVGMGLLADADHIAEVFHAMGWRVIRSTGLAFISGDTPLCKAVPSSAIDPNYGDGGLMNKQVTMSLPLSRDRLLLMGWAPDSKGLLETDREDIKGKNRQRADFAERYLYAHERDEGIRRLGQKRHKSVLAVGGIPADRIEVVRKLVEADASKGR